MLEYQIVRCWYQWTAIDKWKHIHYIIISDVKIVYLLKIEKKRAIVQPTQHTVVVSNPFDKWCASRLFHIRHWSSYLTTLFQLYVRLPLSSHSLYRAQHWKSPRKTLYVYHNSVFCILQTESGARNSVVFDYKTDPMYFRALQII